MGRTVYLFDTFESLPERDFAGIDSTIRDRKSDFIDTSIGAVRALVGSANVEIIAGYFPDSIPICLSASRLRPLHSDTRGPGIFLSETGNWRISHRARLHEPLLGWHRKGNQ